MFVRQALCRNGFRTFTAVQTARGSALKTLSLVSHQHWYTTGSQPAEKERALYIGPLANTAKYLKIFSVSSLALTFAVCPAVFLIEAPISFGMRSILVGAAIATSTVSTGLVHWCLSPYVTKIAISEEHNGEHYTQDVLGDNNPLKTTFSEITPDTELKLYTYKFLGGVRISQVKVGDLEPSNRPFTSWGVKKEKLPLYNQSSNPPKPTFYVHPNLLDTEELKSISKFIAGQTEAGSKRDIALKAAAEAVANRKITN
ncbi:hypothetical protein K493DRAFT_320660 [Basidiobolus meristosporus CBS 931.73]|uniref:Transmembrane protein 186 n=1 Tax=Basidiobolus meristosporus CBS 931.73 TaxID=1314790 RepID=A0A1Y1X6P3_9FUNG|nr:hypothetical protein K493DRAFT_320660 [Basidiobolus meristosporus CBS 931.73]|eukprot:ORX81463.1 hypothetical protein K493DRAFT_320660 [Basidiobolus meristosporus CBS 931.73]